MKRRQFLKSLLGIPALIVGVTLAKGLSPVVPAKGKKDCYIAVTKSGLMMVSGGPTYKMVLLKDGASVRSGKMLFYNDNGTVTRRPA